MILNLLMDRWIQVRTKSGSIKVVAPWEITNPDLERPEWGRGDFNLACYEFLIGVLALACPPGEQRDWFDWSVNPPYSETLKKLLEPYAPAFNLDGEGPLFMQEPDLEGAPKGLDGVIIDSAGQQTIRNNGDVLVHRHRFETMTPAFAAMALYTLQNFAPTGGKGNRTSLRGGGPLVVLINPHGGPEGATLWKTVWANVPYGQPGQFEDLPWMRTENRLSNEGQVYDCPDESGYTVEAFFGMPRRIRLVFDGSMVTGFLQRPYGINYGRWRHPLTPYYRANKNSDWLPRHPRPGQSGVLGFPEYPGVLMEVDQPEDKILAKVSTNIREYLHNERGADDGVLTNAIVGGWSMSNATPRTFIDSRGAIISGGVEHKRHILAMINAGTVAARAFSMAIRPIVGEGSRREIEREDLIAAISVRFDDFCYRMACDPTDGYLSLSEWLRVLHHEAHTRFEEIAVPAMAGLSPNRVQDILSAKKSMTFTFLGYGKLGKELFEILGLPLPENKKSPRGENKTLETADAG